VQSSQIIKNYIQKIVTHINKTRYELKRHWNEIDWYQYWKSM